MQLEDDISCILQQVRFLESRFNKLLEDTATTWVLGLRPEFLSVFMAKYTQNDLDILVEQIGMHNLVSIDVLVKLDEYYLTACVWSISRLLIDFALDFALLLMYDFFRLILKHLDVQNSDERMEEQMKRLKLRYQELKTKSEMELLQHKSICETLKDPSDQPVALLIQYMFENKMFDRRIGGLVEKAEKSEEDEQQFINVKELNGFKIYKFYD